MGRKGRSESEEERIGRICDIALKEREEEERRDIQEKER